MRYLINLPIKQFGGTAPGGVSTPRSLHNALLEKNIPFIEALVNLDQIKKERVIYIGLGLKIQGLDASPIRAIALEEID